MPKKQKKQAHKKARPVRHRTKSGDPKTPQAVKEDIERYLAPNTPPQQAEARNEIHVDPPYDVFPVDVLTLLKTTRVLFYPACEFDWRPLRRFTLPGCFDCQTILYCDWYRDREGDFAVRLKDIPVAMEVESETVITPEQITPASTAAPLDFLRADERERYRDRYREFAVKKGWGRHLMLRGEMGDGRIRRLNFIFLGAEGVATYLQVFNQQRVAPFMLCTVGCGAGFGYNWTDFRVYAEALGRAVESNPNKPMYVVNEGGEPYDWPWNEEVHAVDGMRVFKRPDQAGSKSNPASPTVPKKYPNPFRRRFPPGKKAGPMPKPKMGFGFFGFQADPGNAAGQTKPTN